MFCWDCPFFFFSQACLVECSHIDHCIHSNSIYWIPSLCRERYGVTTIINTLKELINFRGRGRLRTIGIGNMSDGDVQEVLKSIEGEGCKREEFKEGYVKELAMELHLKGWPGKKKKKKDDLELERQWGMALYITVHQGVWKASEKAETHEWARFRTRGILGLLAHKVQWGCR